MKPNILNRFRITQVLAAACITSAAHAAALTWDTTSGDGNAITDGSGTWTNGAGNWNDGTTDAIWNNTTPDSATFTGTVGGTITVNAGGVTQSGLIVNGAQNYNFTGGAIGGVGSLTKNGAGMLTLSNLNTFSGGTTVNGGILSLVDGAGDVGTIRGTLNIETGGEVQFGGWALGNSSTLTNNVTTVNINGGILNNTGSANGGGFYSSAVNMTGGEIKGNSVILYGINASPGSLNTLASASTATISSGLQLRANGGGNGGVTTFTVADGEADTDLLISGGIGQVGTQGITKAGAGKMLLTAANSYTGPTNINAGTLALSGGDNRLATTSTVNFGGSGTLDLGATNQTLATLSFSAGTFTSAVTGSGTLTATNINVFGAAVSASSTMNFGSLGTPLTVNATNMVVASQGTGAVGGNNIGNVNFLGDSGGEIGTLTVGLSTRNNLASNAGNATGSFTMGSGDLTATTIILGRDTAGGSYGTASTAAGTFTTGSGTVKVTTLTLGDKRSGSNTIGVSGTFNLDNGGTLAATTIQSGGTANTAATRTFNWNEGTIKNFDADTDLTFGSGITVNLASTGTHTFDIGAGRTGTVASVLAGANGTLNKAGEGILTLSGSNTYTGVTTVSAGTLLVNGSLGGSNVTVGENAIIGGNGTIGGSLAFADGAQFLFDPDTMLTVNGASVTFVNFGVDDLVGLDSSTGLGTYTLIDGLATINTSGLHNIGVGDVYELGGGKSAYFEIGSLNLVVIPEPAAALLGSLGMLCLLRRRRA